LEKNHFVIFDGIFGLAWMPCYQVKAGNGLVEIPAFA